MNGTLERVEGTCAIAHDDLECLVVAVAANVADAHAEMSVDVEEGQPRREVCALLTPGSMGRPAATRRALADGRSSATCAAWLD